MLFPPDVEKQLNDFASQSGRGAEGVLLDALAGYFEEVKQTRQMLDSRYDDLKAAGSKQFPATRWKRILEKSAAAHRAQQPGS